MLVSIVVDNYNYGRFLRQSVDSALAQTHQDTEVIVVDDGSTDDSREIIAGYGERVRPILKANGGQPSAFNAGFAASRGEIVLFLDADDLLAPSAIERVVAVWRPGVAKVQFPLRVIDREGCETGECMPRYRAPSGNLRATVLRCGGYPSPPTSGNAFARRMLERVLPMAESHILGDAYLIQASAFFGEVLVLPEPLGCYRRHDGNRWAPPELRAEQVRRYLVSDVQRADALREACALVDVTIPPDFLLRSPDHLQGRLASLALDPERHPYPGDRVWPLALKGVRASPRGAYPVARKVLFAGWCLAVAAARGGWRRRVVRLAYGPSARPAFLERVLR